MPRSTRSFLFPDVNVWVALTYSGHIHHQVASEWFRRLDEGFSLCFCRFTQIGMLRLLTTAAVMGKDEVLTQVEAWEAYDRWIEDDRISFLEEPPAMDNLFRSFSSGSHPHPQEWADACLAAFATAYGLQLVTFDRGLARRLNNSILLPQ